MDNNNLLRQFLMLGIGTTSLVAEKIKEVSDEWVQTGRLDSTQASALVDDFLKQFRTDGDPNNPQDAAQAAASWDAQIQRQLRNLLQDLGVPRQNEMDELRGRLDRLERQLRDLENRLWK